MPLISIVIPAYNRGHVIERALRSVLEQTYQDFEVFVVDDCSADNTESVVTSLSRKDSRIHYICHETNRGAQAARNTGIKAANGKWIAFLDSDDHFTPQSLETRILVAQRDGVEVVASKCLLLTKEDNMTLCGTQPLHGDVYKELLHHYGPLFSSLLVTTKALEKIGYIDEKIVSYQDWDTVIRLAKYYPFSFVTEPTFIYDGRGDDNISKNMLREAEGYKQVFKKHFSEILKKLGPNTIALHYRNIAKRYQWANQNGQSQKYLVLSFLWWPFRFNAVYNRVKKIIYT